jgi:drug/metabolite transporter (DMT)-like permease
VASNPATESEDVPADERRRRRRDLLIGIGGTLASSLSWAGAAVLWRSLFDQGMTAAEVSSISAGTGALLLLPFLGVDIRKPKDRTPFEPVRQVWPLVLLIGVLGGTLAICFQVGLELSSATNFGVLSRTDLAFSAILAWLFLRERLKLSDGVGMAVMLVGVVVMVVDFADGWRWHVGDVLFVVGSLLLSINAINVKKVMPRTPAFRVAAFNLTCQSIMLGSLELITRRGGAFQFAGQPLLPSVLLCAVAGIGAAGAIGFYYVALGRLPVWLTQTLRLSLPLFALLLEMAFLGYVPSPQEWLGGGLVIAGAGWLIVGLGGRHADAPAAPGPGRGSADS